MSLVLVNGVQVGAADIQVVIGGVILTGIKEIGWDVKQTKENTMGLQKEPIGRGRGQKEYTNLSMTILLEEWKSICNAAPQRDPTQIAMFSIPIVYDTVAIPSDVLQNCEFTGSSRRYAAGDTAEWITVDMIFAGIRE